MMNVGLDATGSHSPDSFPLVQPAYNIDQIFQKLKWCQIYQEWDGDVLKWCKTDYFKWTVG